MAATASSAPAPTHPASFDAAEAVCKRHAKSFHFASHFLPKRKRRDAFAVYAFCRIIDDAVDETGTLEGKHDKLDEFEAMLPGLWRGVTPSGFRGEAAWVLDAFADTAQRLDLQQAHFQTLIDGCRSDLKARRFRNWPELREYCYQVAGVVGLVMCRVFGLTDDAAEENAVAMGNAMQLTNILRDIGEDLDRGRLYLPQTDMDQFGVDVHDLEKQLVTPGFRGLMEHEIQRALALYRKGAAGLHALPKDGSRQTAAVMAVTYAGILGEIERRGYDIFSSRASLTLPQKMARLPMARALWRRRPGETVPQVSKLIVRGMTP
jgi:phytoene synthase